MDDVLGQVRVVRVPHQPDGHDLRGVHQHPADTKHLSAVALKQTDKQSERQTERQEVKKLEEEEKGEREGIDRTA